MISFRERNPILIGAFSVLGILLGLVFAFTVSRLPLVARTHTIKAEFADAAGLDPSNEVRVAGIKVGKVTKVELLRDRVLVSMAVEREVVIPRDARAEIVLKTILGSKFVAIDARAGGPPMKEGEVIPLSRTKIPFEIYQAANGAVDLISEIDASQLNEAFRALAAVGADPERNLARTLEGAAEVSEAAGSEASALNTLIARGDEVLASLDEASPDIQALLSEANTVAELLARRRATVQSLLRNTDLLAGALGGLLRDNRSRVDSILRDLHATLVIVDANLADLEEAVRILGPSSESLARVFYTGRWANICTFSIEPIGSGEPGGANGPVDCGPNAPNFGAASRPHPNAPLWGPGVRASTGRAR